MSGLKLITPPAVEPITLAEARKHLRVDAADDNDTITNLIKAARQVLDGREGRLNVAMITQTWDLYLDAFPLNEISVPIRPLQSITSVKYDDAAGAEQTVSSTDYLVDTASHYGRVVLAPNKSWPTARDAINAVRVRFVAGYGNAASDVPENLRYAMLLLLGHFYEHRGDSEVAPPPAFWALVGVHGRVA